MLQMHTIMLMSFLSQIDETSVGAWTLPGILGPTGLTIFAVYLNSRNDKSIKAKDREIERLNEERRKDLVSGMLYREQQVDRLLQNDAADRGTDQKMIDAVKALAQVMEKNNVDIGAVQACIREVEKIAIRIETRTTHTGDSSTDVRT